MKRNINTSTGEWAESEFGIVNFGDIRLSKRLLKIVIPILIVGQSNRRHCGVV